VIFHHRHRAAARLSIKTFVAQAGDGIIREAALRELKRGGQVYFLHNEVETIANVSGEAGTVAARGRASASRTGR